MNIDKNGLDALLSLSEDEFSKKINMITAKLGLEQNGVSSEKIRFMLKSMSERDVSNLLSSLGEERSAEIMRILKGGT